MTLQNILQGGFLSLSPKQNKAKQHFCIHLYSHFKNYVGNSFDKYAMDMIWFSPFPSLLCQNFHSIYEFEQKTMQQQPASFIMKKKR